MKQFNRVAPDQGANQTAQQILNRHEVPVEYTWDTEAIFKSPEEWEAAFETLKSDLQVLATYEGRFAEGPAVLAAFLDQKMALEERLDRLYNYASLNRDVDTSNSVNLARASRVQQLAVDAQTLMAFAKPELLALGQARLREYQADQSLSLYRQYLDNETRFAEHTLTAKEERVIATLSPLAGNPYNVFSMLNNADLEFESVKDQAGQVYPVTHGRYGSLLEHKDRTLRKAAFESVYKAYRQFSHTFAMTLQGSTKAHNLEAQLRGFSSARAAAVFENNIPESIQQNLIDTVQKNIDALHDYVALRREKMGLDQLYPYDLYTSMVDVVDLKFTIEEAQELVLEALKPLGEAYQAVLKQAFEQRWIDWMENKGKRSGAYSSGSYSTYPYILMNWQGTLDNVYTLVHELGHSLHSYLTHKSQPYVYGHYCIFLAEIASTTNENLLTHYLLSRYPDEKMQAYIINTYLDGVKGTVFRQTQFAAFEQAIHQADQAGEALTTEFLCQTYGKINEAFYGPALSPCEEITYEWARIPHFYYNFYVYQYATGFSAATAFAKAILEEGKPAVDRYLGFLSSGCSAYPIETLKRAGVDMTKPEPIEATIELFRAYLARYRELI